MASSKAGEKYANEIKGNSGKSKKARKARSVACKEYKRL